jgi:2-octaprenyl-6-methoxyphenol hydroxylase
LSETTVDVAIIGGGMVGASLAVALADSGVSTLLVEAAPFDSARQPSFDDRTTALGNASRRIFDSLGVWRSLADQAAAIRTIHVSDAGRYGFARLRAAEQGIDAFGYVITNRAIGAALWEKLRTSAHLMIRVPATVSAIELDANAARFELTQAGTSPERIQARLLVAADGAHSVVRGAANIAADVVDYAQVAVISHVVAERPHDGTAYERFTDSGPLAVLPLRGGSYGVICSCPPERAQQLLSCDESAFLQQLQQRFGWRAGRFLRAGLRASYPLRLSRAAALTGPRSVLIGNAAQALHPVAGQGFNLGLRDAAMLAEVLTAAPGLIGTPDQLQQFARWRAGDRAGVVRFTDGLIRLFASGRPGAGLLRDLGLLLFDLTPPAKSALARVSAGFAGPVPRLARGLPLRA